MNTRKLIVSLLLTFVGMVSTALADTTQKQATVASVTGNATVTMPDGTTAVLAAGMKVPQGATINTGADGDVLLESHAGYVTSIKKNSIVLVEEISVTANNGKVVKENTTLDLKGGNLVAMLDPKKKAVNNYQVRTPKGVAAARGTVFTITVQYGTSTVSIAVVNGSITVTSTDKASSQSLTVNAGQVTSDGQAVTALNESQAELLAVVAAAAAVAADKGLITAAEAQQVASNIVTAVPAAASAVKEAVQQSAPNQAAAINTSVDTAASNSTSTVTTPATTPTTTVTDVTVRSGSGGPGS
jgi:hypothetical protein